jgi:hypothetical protein
MAQSPEAARHIDKGSYWLTPDSTALTRVVDRDEDGIAIEQTICAFSRWARFVDRNGNICDVPLSNGRMPSHEPEAERYALHVEREQIMNGGLPLEQCPHTTRYAHWLGAVNGGALVKAPEGHKHCDGKPRPADLPHHVEWFGCEHMEAIIKRRRQKAYEAWEKSQAMDNNDLKRVEAMAKGFAQAQQQVAHVDPRANLRSGKGEK